MKAIFVQLSLMGAIFCFSCAEKMINCISIRDGIFYYYPKESSNHYTAIRKGASLKEIIAKSGDTSFWKINWSSECKYTVRYLSGIKMESREMEKFYAETKMEVTIQDITPDYYIFWLK